MEKNYRTKIKEKRGVIDLAHCENYIPWIKANEFKQSYGTRYCFNDLFINRQIHCMSTLERDYYLITRSNANVVAIFEQYPLLPYQTTMMISEQLNYKHPMHPFKKNFIVMTTDFLILYKHDNGKYEWFARAVKSEKQLLNSRVLEKLEIEKAYWSYHGIKWGIITENNIDKTLVYNIMECMSENYQDRTDFFKRLSTKI